MPNRPLQGRAAKVEIQLESPALAGEVSIELVDDIRHRPPRRIRQPRSMPIEVNMRDALRPSDDRQRPDRALTGRPAGGGSHLDS
jgi:hypothetical protein